MPSHTLPSVLIKLYYLDGAPWKWPSWKRRTGIGHGLFPPNDDDLPIGWTRQNAIDVESYFFAYQQCATEDRKIQFAVKRKGNADYPGRGFWHDWITRNWTRWNVHGDIVQALKDEEVHPTLIYIEEGASAWPSSDQWIPKVLDPLGLTLFGEEAFPPGRKSLPSPLRKCVGMLIQRSWGMIRAQVTKLKNRSGEIELAAVAAFQDLEIDKPTMKKVNVAIRAVARWKNCAETLHTPENVDKAEAMMVELQEIMEELGAEIKKLKVAEEKKGVQRKRLCKVSKAALQALASEQSISEIVNVYREYFEMDFDEEEDPPACQTSSADTALKDCDGDLGMEVERKMSYKTLLARLGFKHRFMPIFNAHRHKYGLTPWDDDKLFEVPPGAELPDFLIDLTLHWHQLAGVHSIVRSIFCENSDPHHTTGVLVGDEVGLGKTAQAIFLIAYLNLVAWLQEQPQSKFPTLITERPFLGGDKKIVLQPYLVLCPGTLISQWVSEMKILFLPAKVDILVYDGSVSSHDFWGPSGLYHSSKYPVNHRIIVASHSVLFSDFSKLHTGARAKHARPWVIPKSTRPLENTIFGQSYLMVIVDEAHHMRNVGNKQYAVLRLLQKARVRLIMTATPLHTAPKDIASLGRLVGIPHFSDESWLEEDRIDLTALRRAKKLDDDGEAHLRLQLKIVRRLQEQCAGHFLRRTTSSVDWKGDVLLPLPPFNEIVGVIALTERETAIIQDRAEAAKALVLSSNKRIQTKKFYLEYRTAVGYAKDDLDAGFPSFKSLEEWMPVRSTKMDVCAKICAHYLKCDDVPDVQFVDGAPVFPEIATCDNRNLQRSRRILIYSEFSSMAPLLQNVLQLYGIQSLAINGTTTFRKRDKHVKELHKDNNPARVLIFSSIGSAGLNLSIADVIIFFDQPWSAQDERQIRGRAHRQPQTKNVKVIYLLASDSADLLLHDMARGKASLFDAFVNKELGDDLRAILNGYTPYAAEHDVDEENQPQKKTRSKAKKVVDDKSDVPPDIPLPPVSDTDGVSDNPFTTDDEGIALAAAIPCPLASDTGGVSDHPMTTDTTSGCTSDFDDDPRDAPMAGASPPRGNSPPMNFDDDLRDTPMPGASPPRANSPPSDFNNCHDPSDTQDVPIDSDGSQADPFSSYPKESPQRGSPGNGHSPPAKRRRQGTIGPETRANIEAKSESVGAETSTGVTRSECDTPMTSSPVRTFLVPRGGGPTHQSQRPLLSSPPPPTSISMTRPTSSSISAAGPKPRRRPFVTLPIPPSAPSSTSAHSVHPNAESSSELKAHRKHGATSRHPEPLTTSRHQEPLTTSSEPLTTSSKPPHRSANRSYSSFPHLPSQRPSRDPTSLDEVPPMPNRAALSGIRPAAKPSKKVTKDVNKDG